ncbi:hypothetical protein CEXT_643671 [Caerostris extrusa]|uniref:Uncharacterized protein n=1 Tax=Caerostris extrusa TaxID=172846 RepID=A0AAV4XWM6_CAEEX|nr:hypothetical protein CEXT_643671 [Caerostris extrusa]
MEKIGKRKRENLKERKERKKNENEMDGKLPPKMVSNAFSLRRYKELIIQALELAKCEAKRAFDFVSFSWMAILHKMMWNLSIWFSRRLPIELVGCPLWPHIQCY